MIGIMQLHNHNLVRNQMDIHFFLIFKFTMYNIFHLSKKIRLIPWPRCNNYVDAYFLSSWEEVALEETVSFVTKRHISFIFGAFTMTN